MDSIIDVDDGTVLSKVFQDRFPHMDHTEEHFLPYLSQLCSSSLIKLSQEPGRLNNEKSLILQQTQDLAFHNYKTFISTADCSKGIVKDFSVIETKVQDMLESLPKLVDHGQHFLKEAGKMSNVRQFSSLTLSRHTEILEVLEIPQLMNTFIKNQYYDDALDLLSYVKRISKKHFIADIPVIKTIINEVKTSSKLLLDQLLSQLRTTVQLPVCLRVVGYLRRLECFTEVELRIKFLQLRNTWFESKLNMLPSDLIKTNSYEYMTQIIEIYRVHLFDIVTQYRAIFSDDTSFPNLGRDSINTDDLPQESSIFCCWLSYRISCFLEDLQTSLQSVDGRFDFILGQSMYFGQSFSRVGCDFRCLLLPIFQEAVKSYYSKSIEQVSTKHSYILHIKMFFSLLFTAGSYCMWGGAG